MYVRPELLSRDFLVERKTQAITDAGRKAVTFRPTGDHLKGVLAEAKALEIERWKQLQHPITHTIVMKGGRCPAKIGDRLVFGGRSFYVQGIDNIGALSIFTQIFAEERSDTNA